MTVWIVEPRDPLIVRDGRPFGPNPGARAKSLAFPFPSTIAGGVRTRAGQNGNGLFDINKIDDVKKVSLRGPLLAELNENGIVDFMVPAPADALLVQDQKTKVVTRHRLRPLRPPSQADSNLPQELSYSVGLIQDDLPKPYKKAPSYWYWNQFKSWLISPPKIEILTKKQLVKLGHAGPDRDRRTHVAIDPATLAGEDGALFATSGLTFSRAAREDDEEIAQLSQIRRLGLAVEVTKLAKMEIEQGVGSLGGERRTMVWQPGGKPLPTTIPGKLTDKIIQSKGYCRLILLTPAYFEEGWRPTWLVNKETNIKVELKAAVVGKPQTVSGWDFVARGPKPTRRLVPAGSVYFLQLSGTDAAIKKWLKDTWLQNISDTSDDQLAGFGLAAIGSWDGTLEEFSKKEVQNE